MESPKQYDPKEAELKWQKHWEKNNIYKADVNTKKPVYSIDTPPPTMSGKMHLGHAFSFSQQDFIARYKRMRGYQVYYPFGTDDNGLATEKLVQKEKKVDASKMEREAFIKLCLDFLKEERPKFVQDWKNIGMSCDFSLIYSTIDDYSRKISQRSFLDLAKKGLVYRKEAPVMWDTVFHTAIAQAELVDVEKKSFFNDIIFTADDGKKLTISTTRPEMLAACVALFAHPEDQRYQKYFGKYAYTPLYKAKVPILPDEKANPEKGTGIVMCCTFGDQTDIEWYKKHDLPLKMIITKDGRMDKAAGKYAGMKIEEARKEITEDLKNAGLLVKQQEIIHTVNVGERSEKPVEIINSQQWYVKYLDKKERFLQAAEELQWHPYHMKHRLDNWIKGLNWDWSISRQRKFGVPIPVWYDMQGKVYYADETQLPVDPLKDKPLSAAKGIELIPETDVFDTWFTSASSPLLAANLVEGQPIYHKLFPMNLRPQAHDIINFWLFYTMAKSQLIKEINPWSEVIISGFVLDPKGEKMSKSKGNVIAPQDVIAKFSADAVRFWAATSKLGEDLPYQEKDVLTGQKFVTKLWNASKFALMHLSDYKSETGNEGSKPAEIFDKWLLSKLHKVILESTDSMEQFEYAKTRSAVEFFFWHTLCDNYLEIVKDRLYNPDIRGAEEKQSAQYALYHALLVVLKLIAPIMPHITEEIYQMYFAQKENEKSIHLSAWPEFNLKFVDEKAELTGDLGVDIINTVRKYKSGQQLSLKEGFTRLILGNDDLEFHKMVKSMEADLKAVLNVKEIVFAGKTSLESEKFGIKIGITK